MENILIKNVDEIKESEKKDSENYQYKKKTFIKRNDRQKCVVAVYTLAPSKSNYPYHYHLTNEETFFIISGHDVLDTPEGRKEVKKGDLIFFPAGERGAHKLTNNSETEDLVYIDFDTNDPVDVALYPNSKKIGVFSKNISKVFKIDDDVPYYKGE